MSLEVHMPCLLPRRWRASCGSRDSPTCYTPSYRGATGCIHRKADISLSGNGRDLPSGEPPTGVGESTDCRLRRLGRGRGGVRRSAPRIDVRPGARKKPSVRQLPEQGRCAGECLGAGPPMRGARDFRRRGPPGPSCLRPGRGAATPSSQAQARRRLIDSALGAAVSPSRTKEPAASARRLVLGAENGVPVQFGAVVEAQLLLHARLVCFDRLDTQVQPRGDLPHRQALAQ